MSEDTKKQIDVATSLLAEHSKDVRAAAILRWQVTVVLMTIMAAILYILLEKNLDIPLSLKILGYSVIVFVIAIHFVWQRALEARIQLRIELCQVLDQAIQSLLQNSAITGYEDVRANDPELSKLSFNGLIVVSTCVAIVLCWLIYISPIAKGTP